MKIIFNINKLLIILIVFSMFFSFLYMNLFIFIIFAISSIILVCKENKYVLFVVNEYKNTIYVLFVYLILFSMFFIVFYNYSTIVYFLLIIWSIFLAIIFLKDNNLKYLYCAIKYLIYIYISGILIYLFFTYGKYPLGYSLEYMINEKVSANGVTSFLNIILSIYTALRMKLYNKSSLIISLLSLYIAIEGYGRGLIIFVLIMIIINFIFIFFHLRRSFKLAFLGVFVLLLFIIYPIGYEIYQTTKLASGFESPRFVILHEYLNKIDIFSLFFGVSYENTIIADKYNNNPHITYIRTHHIFGLFYLIGLFYIILSKLLIVFKSKDLVKWMILLIVFNVLLRTISEPLLFPSLFDSLFLVMLFLITKTNKRII